MDKYVRTLYLNFDEEAKVARLEKVRGFSVDLVERLYLCTARNKDHFFEHKRLEFPGSNRGNVLGPIKMPPFSDESQWATSVKLKREIIQGAACLHRPPTHSRTISVKFDDMR